MLSTRNFAWKALKRLFLSLVQEHLRKLRMCATPTLYTLYYNTANLFQEYKLWK